MANWQRHIYLNPEWNQCKADEISLQECARSIAAKLRAVDPLHGHEKLNFRRIEIAEQFEAVANDARAQSHHINAAMRALYDWGDTALDDKWNGRKVCWIDTISPAKEVA